MANTVKVNITASDEGFKQTMTQASNSVTKLGQVMSSNGTKFKSLQSQLTAARKEAQILEAQWREMDNTMRNSDFGRSLKAQLDQVYQKAGQLQDIKEDVQKQIKNLASDTLIWDGAKQGIQILSSSIQGLAGVVGMCGGDVKAFTKALTVMRGVEAAANTVIGIGNALQKDSALMVMLRTVRTKLLTRATEEQTVAQAANNAMALANPYIAVAAAVVALTVAIVALCDSTKEATELEKIHEEATKRNKEAQEDWAKSVANSAGEQLAKYSLLQQKWKECNGDVKLQGQFLRDYASEIKSVTGRQLDLISAEDIFVRKTDLVVAAIKARAEAEAGKELYIKSYKKKLENDYNGTVANGRYVANVPDTFYGGTEKSKLTQEERDMLKHGEDYTVNLVDMPLTPRGKEKIRKHRAKNAAERRKMDNDEVSYWEKFYLEREKKAAELAKLAGINPGGGGGGNNKTTNKSTGSGHNTTTEKKEERKAAEQSLAWLREQLQEKQKALENGWIQPEKIEEEKAKIEYLKKDIEKKEIELGFKIVPTEGSLADLEEKISKLRNELSQGLIPDSEIDNTLEQIDNLERTAKAKRIQLGIDPTPVTDYEKRIDQYVSEYNKYLKQQAIYEQNNLKFAAEREKHTKYIENETKKINDDFKNGLITLSQYNDAMDKLNDEIIEFNIKASDATEAVQSFAFTNKSMDNIARHLEEQIHDIDKQLSENDLTVDARVELNEKKADIQKKLNNLINGELSIPAKIEPEYIKKGSADDFRQSYNNASQQIQDIVNDYNMGIIKSVSDARSQVDAINNQLKELGLKPVRIVIKSELQNNIEEGVDITKGMTDNLHGLYSTLSGLADRFDECKDGAEQFFLALDTGFSIIDSIMSFIEKIQMLIEFIRSLTGVTQANTLASQQSAAAKEQEALADAAGASAAIGKAGANAAQSATEASSQMSSTGPWGWIAGIAAAIAIAGALFGIISQAKGFATGGIIGGSTTTGDKLLARVNAGEMILNQRHQSRLFNMIDHGQMYGSDGPQVSNVRIKGSDLYLALKNYGKITNKTL